LGSPGDGASDRRRVEGDSHAVFETGRFAKKRTTVNRKLNVLAAGGLKKRFFQATTVNPVVWRDNVSGL
jgi:hypothetical protein